MPTYSYRCTECEKAFDVQQSFTDSSLTVCPSCSGVLRKVFSPVGVSFTGSGFYRNDSRATPDSDKAKNKTGSSEKSASSDVKSTTSAKESKVTTAPDSSKTKAATTKPAL